MSLLEEDALEGDPTALAKLPALVAQADRLQNEINGTEALLEQLKADLFKLLTKDIVEVMQKARMPSVTGSSGRTVELKTIVAGTWPGKDKPEARAAATKWMEEEKLTDLIKCDVVVKFDKGDRDSAQEFLTTAQKNNVKKSASLEESVHHQTLNAMLRERVRDGKEVPLKLFSGYTTVIAEITEPGGRKSKK